MDTDRTRASTIVLAFALGTLLTLTGSRPVTAQEVDGDPASTVQAALERALDDERHAIAFYEAVMARFGERSPFSNIVHAERRHAEALLRQYARLGLEPPADRWQSRSIQVPDSFAEACDLAEIAEIRNVAMYDGLIATISDATVRTVFEQLRAASQERHLPAFRRHGNGWRALGLDDLSATQKTQQALARQARDDVFQQLLARLGKELKAGGPAGAIAVCRDVAPQITQEVGRARDVRIGRTSWKLRNPRNVGPPWTDLLLHDQPDAPRVATARDGRLGVTLPIRVAGKCLMCHGPAESIDPAVRLQLRENYPTDRAVGFREGDLRGWFWVEVPPGAADESGRTD
jgi:rubrerythrin